MDDFEGLLLNYTNFRHFGEPRYQNVDMGSRPQVTQADTDESARVDLDEQKSSPSPCLSRMSNQGTCFLCLANAECYQS